MKKRNQNIRNRKIGIFIFLLSLMSFQMDAAQITWLGGTGAWNDRTNWDSGTVPNFGDDVFINSGVVQISKNAKTDYLYIDNNGAVEILSSGGLYVTNGETGLGIYNLGTLTNYGIVDVSLTYGGISNEVGATIDNYADMTLTSAGGFGGTCITNQGIFKNWGSGILQISAIAEGASTISNTGTGASFINKGDISIFDCNTSSILREDGHLFLNDRDASIDIDNVEGLAIDVFSNGTFRNKSNIYISDVDINRSIAVKGFMVNHQRGNIYIDHATGIRVFSGAEMRNYGLIKFTDEQSSLQVEGVFANRPMGKFICNRAVYVSSGASLASQGHFVSEFQGGGAHFIGGTCNNTGVFNDVNDDLNTSAINNQSIIVKPLTGVVQNGVPYPNALEVGSLSYVTIQGWYVSQTSSVSAGSYNSSTNTFTPNGNAVGLDAVWVKIKINQGNRVHRHKVKIPGSIQAIASSIDGSLADLQGAINPELNATLNEVTLYPNPTVDKLTIQLNSIPDNGVVMLLNDLSGKLIMRKILSDRITTFSIDENIRTGVYAVSLLKNDEQFYSTKLVIR